MELRRLRILFLTPQLPYPPRQGTSIRNYYLIRHLAERHDVQLVTFLAPGEALTPDSPLHELCARIRTVPQPRRSTIDRLRDTLLSSSPDMGLRLLTPDMLAQVEAVDFTDFDVIQFEGIEMAPYGLYTAKQLASPIHGQRGPILVFDDHNCEYLLQQRNAQTDLGMPRRWPAAGYSIVQTQKLRRYERAVCNASDLVIAVSDPDKKALQRLGISTPIVTVPNGIETSAYRDRSAQQYDVVAGDRIVFTGKMDYRPNIDAALWFGTHVFPLIQVTFPDSVFQVVGQQPHPRLDVLRRNPGIEITGAVPEIEPYLATASVFAIPMRVGGGTRFKALEAMSAGLPIVTTSLGVEGIDVRDGNELLIRDTADEFARAVIQLLQDQHAGGTRSAGLGQAGRAFVERQYDWATLMPTLEAAYTELLARDNSSLPASSPGSAEGLS